MAKSTQKPPPQTVEVVDPKWLLKAAGLVVLAALLCAYLAVCGLFWQGQWQLVLHPTAKVYSTPAALVLPFEEARFGNDVSGKPQLAGWWIPSDSAANPTVLLLHDGSGNIADALPTAHSLHAAGLNIFVFDYRGFGASAGPHPTEARMDEDADSALNFVAHSRNIPISSILLFGEGSGAAVATHIASQHKEIAALMLFRPVGDFKTQVRNDPRSRAIPVFLLFHEDFPLAKPLHDLSTPKLVISAQDAMALLDVHALADPKMTVEIRTPSDMTMEPLRSVRRFLDTYVPTHPDAMKMPR